VLVSECDDFEDCDVTSLTSLSREDIDGVTNRRAVDTFVLDKNPKWLSFRDI